MEGTPSELFIGLMSGTSLDGVDAALVSFHRSRITLVDTHYLPYPDDIRQRCLALQTEGPAELHSAAVLSQALAELYALTVGELLKKSGVDAQTVCAIGAHGQTVRHNPQAGYSLQLNQPALLAERTGIAVVADFRSRDIAAGGQGAPLVPAFHEAVFRDPGQRRVVVNIGGMANLTDLTPNAPILGFDCGPGNILMDAWITKHRGEHFDRDGAWARSGKLLPNLLSTLIAHPFFMATPPKSCGREEFNLTFVESHLSGKEAAADVQRTLLELTALSATQAIRSISDRQASVLVCGGGAHNSFLLARMQNLLGAGQVSRTDDCGLKADWVEAVAFAWLARQAVLGLPGNLPRVTGAKGPRVLGAVYPA